MRLYNSPDPKRDGEDGESVSRPLQWGWILAIAAAAGCARPITYTETVQGPPGWPQGTLGAIAFGGGNNAVKLTLTFDGSTGDVVAFHVPRTSQAVNDGVGFQILTGTSAACRPPRQARSPRSGSPG